MRGLFKRTGSDVWQGKFRVPEAIWRHRPRLIALDVKDIGKAQEFGRTTGKLNRDEAAEVYRVMLVKWDEKLSAWQALLDTGPQSLSYKQRLALAADHAKAFLVTHEDEPFDAPPGPSIPESPTSGLAAWTAMVGGLEQEARRSLLADIKAFLRARGKRRDKLAFHLIEKHPYLAAVAGSDLAAGLEAMHGAQTDAALAAKGLHVDATTRQLINFEMAGFMGAVERGLEARRDGRYGQVPELASAPAFEALRPPAEPQQAATGLSLEYLLDHKARTTDIRAKTVTGNRTYIKKFAKFLHHDDARRVTREDVRRWRDSLMETDLAPKTISDRYLSAVRAVLTHGVKEFDLPFNAASGLADNRAGKAPERSKAWSEEEALQILKATFGGSSKTLSEPHRRALFWLPWMVAYTGLRAGEVAQFRGRHLKEEDGIPYFLITPADGSTKSGKAWTVGIHKHLIDLGLLDFIRKVGDGPLFYEPYPANVDPGSIKGRHRAADAAKRVGDWITGEVGLKAPLGKPLHAFRHLFTTRSRPCGMNKEARDFMLGSRSVTDAREGYGDWPPSVLDAEINKLPRFTVEDTGWRPRS